MRTRPSSIPALSAGIGLKNQHFMEAARNPNAVDFFEVHAENFMGAGGPPHHWLTQIRDQAPLSLHGVCLSIGGRERLDRDHLHRLAEIVDVYQPSLVSEHLAWSSDEGVFFNDLLAPPLTEATLTRIAENVDELQCTLGCTVLIENPSTYAAAPDTDIPEPEFLNALARTSGCGLLLDINNVYVSAKNCGFNARDYVDAIEVKYVGEIHMAGHAIDQFEGRELLVDNHGAAPCAEVVELFKSFIGKAGPRPTLLEWDTDTPPFESLAAQAGQLRAILRSSERSHEPA